MDDAAFHRDLQNHDPQNHDLQNHELHRFAVELRQLAYTMPAGHEDRLIHLAERMAAHSRQHRERGPLA